MTVDRPAPFWSQTAEQLFRLLDSGPLGLSSAEASARLGRFGYNQIEAERRRHFLVDLARRLLNPLVAILLVAAAVAGVTGDIASFAIILVVVLLSCTLDMVQERRAEATAEALRRSIALRADVVRDAAPSSVDIRELVPGDIVNLSAGDLVPADGIVLMSRAAQVNEALLTGEPYPVEKGPGASAQPDVAAARNALFHGSAVIAGSLQMLVVKTGSQTRFGMIAASLAARQPPTAFERGIHRLGILIVRLTLFLILFVLLAHLALGRPPLESFLFAIALAVGLTPELLPMIVTVALARGAQRMAHARVIVKRLSAIHDLGQMDIFCTDKTGTLTEARIALIGHIGTDGRDSSRVIELAVANARFESGLKSPLDDAILMHAGKECESGWIKLDERPFDFERRRVSVLLEHSGSRIEIVKGAPEAILSLCTQLETPDGTCIAMDGAARQHLQRMHDARAAEGLRLLAVAWKAAAGRERIETDDDSTLIFVGFCVFVDPPKHSARGAIAQLEAAGVRVKIVSGDAPQVVDHLVTALGLSLSGLLTGDEIDELDEAVLAARVESIDLFARVTPDQKLRIVRALQLRGHTVGFIGDGINDAPAIRAADVGLSVDGATDVAREAADMILLDQDLEVVSDGIAEGRRTYANIMKYIRMGTSSNFGNMLSMAFASLFLPFLPLTAIQVLLNNLLYDLSQLGIPFDDADQADVVRPCNWDMKALVRFTATMGPWSSLFDLATFGLLLGIFHVGIEEFRASWFIESMATQVLVVFVIRTSRPIWLSRPHVLLTLSALGGLAVAILLPFLSFSAVLGFVPISPSVAGAIGGLVLIYLAGAEMLKRRALRPSA
ncbi:magnesium-translocating P-type ATPase [Flavisphingomonas formosensis]|uniref:magnesium-translocating P-type ATPase n=1 Tax=Flavisphingomonas formosensis TaxID=861534 RepID=UPI001E559B1A|nr:magnesium-translocating P-type ATPase [Sphingomonas formosensis]